jgi:predicted DNA-binding transcriptional regulator AlpA
MKTETQDYLIDSKEVMRRYGLRKMGSLYNFMDQGVIPKPRKIGGRKNVWSSNAINAALAAMFEQAA